MQADTLKLGHLLPFDSLLIVIKLDTYKSVMMAISNVVVSYSDEFEPVACNFLTTSPLEFLLAAHTKSGLPDLQPGPYLGTLRPWAQEIFAPPPHLFVFSYVQLSFQVQLISPTIPAIPLGK